MICPKYKFLYIHIPKTGGTSIESIFNPKASVTNVPYKHHTLRGYENLNKHADQYFKFSFVRNPWDMTASMYNYLWKKDAPWPNRWRDIHKEFSKLSFKEWVVHPSFQFPTIRSVDVNPNLDGRDGDFSSWLVSKNYTINFIGRYENLQGDFNTVCDKIGIPLQQLPHKNKSKHKHYAEYYDDETREIVARKYAKDIECFGYEFEQQAK